MTTLTTDALASGAEGASVFTPSFTKPEVVTLQAMIEAYLQEYEVRQYRINIARCRVAHLRTHFGDACPATDITTYRIRQYQVARRQQGAATGTVNRETSALTRMFRIVIEWGWLEGAPLFPGRLRENAPRQGFFEHGEYQTVRNPASGFSGRPGLCLLLGMAEARDSGTHLGWVRRSESRPVRRSESGPPEGGSFYAF